MPTSMARNLSGKTVLITGASSGIGRSTAFEFARTCVSHLKLILTARRIGRLHELASEIAREVGSGVEVHVVRLDISKSDEIASFVGKLPADFRDIDILVNNA